MNKCKKRAAALFVLFLLFSGCGKNISGNQNNYTSAGSDASKDSSVSDIAVDTSDMFSDRDYETGFDASEGVLYQEIPPSAAPTPCKSPVLP